MCARWESGTGGSSLLKQRKLVNGATRSDFLVVCNVEVAIVYYKRVAMESGVGRVGGQRHVRVGTMLDLSGE